MSWWNDNPKFWTQVLCIGFFFALEWIVPYFEQRDIKLVHDFKNLTIAFLNGIIGSLFFAFVVVGAIAWSEQNHFGLLYLIEVPDLIRLVVAFLLFDCWMYWWHRINHVVPELWKFHRMHHTDTAMNASTSLRFHPVEILLSFLFRILIIPLIGMNFAELLVYEVALQVIIVFQHSNVHMTRRFDRMIRTVFVSPHMHKVHHSDIVNETNSNYSSVFSFWDRIFGTYVSRSDVHNIRYGLKEFPDPEWSGIVSMLKLPFRRD